MTAANRSATPRPQTLRPQLDEISSRVLDRPKNFIEIPPAPYLWPEKDARDLARVAQAPSPPYLRRHVNSAANGELRQNAQAPSTQSSHCDKEVGQQSRHGSTSASAAPSHWHSLLAAALMLLAILWLAYGGRSFARAVADDSRAQNIRMFRLFLNKSSKAAVPLPATFLYGRPPPRQLKATWTPADLTDDIVFQLDQLEVPLTQEVLGDFHDIDDESPLPVVSSGPSSVEDKDDLPSVVKRSILYRAEVPAKAFWAAERTSDVVQKGRLDVLLPDGTLLLQHAFEPVKMEFGEEGEGSMRVSERAVKRLCYALPHDDAPWYGEAVQDCEWRPGLRTPAYIPLPDSIVDETVEIVIRASRDAYVYASETTHGCSSCYGQPYGDSRSGLELLSCDDAVEVESNQRCFGAPARWAQARALARIAIAALLLVSAFAFSTFSCRGALMTASLLAFVFTLHATIAVYFGLPGVLARSWSKLIASYPEWGRWLVLGRPMLIAVAALLLGFLAKALFRIIAPRIDQMGKRRNS